MSQVSNHHAHSQKGWAIILSFALIAAGVLPFATIPASAASAFTCTEVLGFSQTNNWFSEGGTFEPIVGDANWQERWYSGGSIDLWSYFDGAPWYASVISNCTTNSGQPDRVLLNISGAYNNDPLWWQTETQGVITALANNTAHGYNNNWSNVRQIILQSVVGGPNGAQCPTTDTQPAVQYGINRASYNFPYINQGIDLAVAANGSLMSSSGHAIQVLHGASPTVDSCSDYADGVGHLTPTAESYIGTRLGQYYASGSATSPTSTPVAAATSVPATPVATATAITAPSAGGCPCGVFSYSGAPDVPDVSDNNAVELGLKFRSDTAGQITGVRFYKGPTNTGTHVGNMWSATGQLLATATFSGESTSGWQVVSFANPVQIAANTAYVASYHTNVGQYSATRYGLTNQVDYSSLHTLASSSSGGNGVYRYGTQSAFPNQSYNATNYWVDVVFMPTGVASNPTPAPTSTATAVPTSTTTAVPTSTPAAVATPAVAPLVLTFDALQNPNRTLIGQEAASGVDFGNGPWWLSGPWGQFTTNSISFNSSSTSASINFLAPRTLLQLTAYNGGTSASTITISSPGQTSRVVTVAAHQVLTITTGFTAAGTSVTIASSNGWNTNFDNLVIQ